MKNGSPKQRRVLVVDDDAVTLEVTRERLERAGWDVVVQQGGLGTAAVAARARPDVLLLDVNMPALSGTTIAKLISDSGKNPVPIVLLFSSMDRVALDDMAAKCGAQGGVRKTSDEAAFIVEFERAAAQSAQRAAR
jgi:two-component system, OmpR family, response regulator